MEITVKKKDKYACEESKFNGKTFDTRYFHLFCDICGARHPDICVNDFDEGEGFPVGAYCWECQMCMRAQGFVTEDKTTYFWREDC